MRAWTSEDAVELYNISHWGINYFGVNQSGNVVVRPRKDAGPAIDLRELMAELVSRDIPLPVLLRFVDIIGDRIAKICGCFEQAAKEYEYGGKYFAVYPIKVNQQRHVVEEVVRYGKRFNIGLEAGSRPELQAVLSIMENPEAVIVCNGYKDAEFIELALLAQKMGKRIFLVVEKLNELRLIARISREVKVVPNIGIRIKLSNAGAGKWEESGGDQSKFGLNSVELLEAIQIAKAEGLESCVRMIHFHLGSQITNIRRIKEGLKEIAHYYAQIRNMDCDVSFVDIGGGLGVDYDGSRSIGPSSINYSMQEYANDTVYALADVCRKYDLPQPNIISESGRALTAHHSVLVFNVLGKTSLPEWDDELFSVEEDDHDIVKELYSIFRQLTPRRFLEHWHDAQEMKEDIVKLFGLGLLDLRGRAKAERLYWSIAKEIKRFSERMKQTPPELQSLARMLVDKYFCNFSLFQSLPDAWAIDQLFPLVPLHRLNEKPTQMATLQDITCDSDGKVDKFVTTHEDMSFLPVHTLEEGEPYYIGAFLVGAYQEILGDLHNLFGDTSAVHVTVTADNSFKIDQVIEGETVADVLEYVQFEPKTLVRKIEKWVNAAVKEGKITTSQAREFLQMYRSGLYDYTYLGS